MVTYPFAMSPWLYPTCVDPQFDAPSPVVSAFFTAGTRSRPSCPPSVAQVLETFMLPETTKFGFAVLFRGVVSVPYVKVLACNVPREELMLVPDGGTTIPCTMTSYR